VTQETDDKFTLIQIPDDWEPVDEDRGQQRALFLCHAIDGHVRQNLVLLLSKCRDGAYGKSVQQSLQKQVNEWVLAAVIKQITCVSIHRAWLEQGGDEAPDWLLSFALVSQQETDEICAQPEASELIEGIEQLQFDEIIPALFDKTCQDLGFNGEDEASDFLCALILSTCDLTRELLLLSLSQPLDSLHRHLLMYQR